MGYGDLNVKSLPARLFSVVWILIGISMFGLTTSLITVELMKTQQTPFFDMYGSHVGVLKYHDYDSALVVAHGGIVSFASPSSSWNFFTNVMALISMLMNNEISGFVVDKYTLAYIDGYFKWKLHNPDVPDVRLSPNRSLPVLNSEHRGVMDFYFKNTYRTLKEYTGEKMSYGALVRNSDVYDYFHNAIRDNRFIFNSKTGSEMNAIFPKEGNEDLFTPSGKYFKNTMTVLFILLGAICVFGACYELWKRKDKIVAKVMMSRNERADNSEEHMPL